MRLATTDGKWPRINCREPAASPLLESQKNSKHTTAAKRRNLALKGHNLVWFATAIN
jgi:GH35 family endo-1,4-beta-xylanase